MVFDSDLQRIGQTVGAKLRAARLARNYTQSQLAQPDFSVSYVSAIERGQIHPSLRALQIFAQRLGISSSDLLSEQTVQALQGFSEKVAAHEKKEDIELQLLEAQLFIYQGNERQAVALLRNLSSDALTSEQEIRKRYLLGWAFYHLGFLQESESILADIFFGKFPGQSSNPLIAGRAGRLLLRMDGFEYPDLGIFIHQDFIALESSGLVGFFPCKLLRGFQMFLKDCGLFPEQAVNRIQLLVIFSHLQAQVVG